MIEKTAEQIREEGLELVRQVLDLAARFRDTTANEEMILSACAGKPMNLDTVCEVYERLRTKGQLAENSAWTESFQALRKAHPEWSFNEAVLRLLEDAWTDPKLAKFDVSADALIRVAEALNAKSPFTLTNEYLQAQAEIVERARLIKEISEGKDSYVFIREDGKHVVYSTHGPEGLDPEPTERLREIAALMANQRLCLQTDSKTWLETKRKENIRKAQEQAGMISTEKILPTHWTPSEDGSFSNTGPVIKAGVPVVLNSETFRRMSLTDLRAITLRYGGKLVNEKLVGAKQFGNIQYVS